MAQKLMGKNAVVTGSGRGIGKQIALALAAEGAKVVVNDPGVARDGSGGDLRVADTVGKEITNAHGVAVANYDSVVDFTAAENIVKTCVDNFGSIDILVNNAGFLRDRMIFNMSEKEWKDVIDVMLNGTFNCCRHACVLMKQQRSGRIINITSDAWRGTVGHANYGAAKAGIVGLTRAIAREMGRYGVTCNAVAPLAATRLTLDDDVIQGAKKRVESGVMTQEQYDELVSLPGPDGVPPMIVYLCTDAAADINGMVFHSDSRKIAIYSEPVEARPIIRDYKNEGLITVDELIELVPQVLLVDYVNPAPPQPPKE